jgi:uncharacterized membrane protein
MYMESFRQRRYLIDIALSAVAVGVIVFYSICGNSCSYLKGSILGVELQYVGIAYMAALIFLNLLKKDFFILVFLSAGLGIEAFLVGFQIVNAKYCPYCLIFGLIVIVQFVLNFDRKRRWFVVSSMIIAMILFAMLFKGTAFPTYVMKSFFHSKANCFSLTSLRHASTTSAS